jgi:hypothetical protein
MGGWATTPQNKGFQVKAHCRGDHVREAVDKHIGHPLQDSASRRTKHRVGHIASKEAANVSGLREEGDSLGEV